MRNWDPIVCWLTPAELEKCTREVVGNGGHQRLLRKILSRLDPLTGRLEILVSHLHRAAIYARAYGLGGYQQRFQAIVAAAARAGA